MKKKFSSYFNKISDETIEKMLKNGLISFDTNILLNLYSKSDENVNDFFETLENDKVKSRVRLPYHIAKKFINKRKETVNNEMNKVNTVMGKNKETLAQLKEIINQSFDSSIHGENLDEENIEKFNEDIEKAIKFIDSKDFLKDKAKNTNDSIFEKIGEVFDDKIGEKLDWNDFNLVKQKWENRCDLYIPPGYADYEEEGFDKFSGLIVWEELIKFSKESKKDMIFVTNDNKKDWKISLPDGKLVPHHELLCEFKEKTDGQKIYFLEYDEFINKMGKILKIKINPQSKKEDEIINQNQFILEGKILNTIKNGFDEKSYYILEDDENKQHVIESSNEKYYPLFEDPNLGKLKLLSRKLKPILSNIEYSNKINEKDLIDLRIVINKLDYINDNIYYTAHENIRRCKALINRLRKRISIEEINGSDSFYQDELVFIIKKILEDIFAYEMKS
ncbi:hypothetical protein MARBORIA2_11710 [Methanobrevibacter arboriphilus]|uniref:PIN-like domain-containing protein n=1 Tax=Methanobrevibacter arboriphilus TaxID=39441 RepID=UPI0022EF174A|nr:PIN-like domain-containing protein [Methanobrevibacter arboriphilus]GLI12081.1 hypothetical protein MARBORIA2_11710 [Methanobrevibacter arboriphilus]